MAADMVRRPHAARWQDHRRGQVAKCTINITADDLVSIVNGKLNAQMAFMTGKLKVAGDMGLALKLGSLLG